MTNVQKKKKNLAINQHKINGIKVNSVHYVIKKRVKWKNTHNLHNNKNKYPKFGSN